jgi:hypothetical protein
MSSVKCPNCGLTNFATAQFCKRCNLSLNQNSDNRIQNATQILNQADNTHVRQTPPVRQYERQNGNSSQNRNNQQSYRENPFAHLASEQPPSTGWTLPKFPNGVRPEQNNSYQNFQGNYYQPTFQTAELPFRRMGSEVALHKNATLPEICVNCGEHISSYNGGVYESQKFKWHHPAVYAALVSPLIYVILAACLSERFTVDVPLCSKHLKSRENALNGMIIGGLLGTLLAVLCIGSGAVGFGIFLLIVGIVILGIFAEYGYKSLRVKKIEGSYYYLTGASNEFLSNLPH